MQLVFHLSGSTLYSTKSDSVPTVGSVVCITTEAYKKGLHAGSIIQVPITSADPPEWDFTDGGKPVVYISCNGYTVVKEGPPPEDD